MRRIFIQLLIHYGYSRVFLQVERRSAVTTTTTTTDDGER